MTLTTPDVELFRKSTVEWYKTNPTGCGGSFGELLCYEIHSAGLTFKELAQKWEISVAFLGDVIADHCRKL